MVQEQQRYVVYADVDKCIACRKCELACIASHHNLTIKDAAKARKRLEPRIHVIRNAELKYPVQCHQCFQAPCAAVCPTTALVQEGDDGDVYMRAQYCASCGTCVLACPYGVITPSFIERTQVEKVACECEEPRFIAVRCDQCREWRRIEEKDITACVETCPADVLHIVPLEEYRSILAGMGVPV